MPSTPEQPYLELLPAVDIKGGQAVQLVQGVDGSEKRFGDPVEAAFDLVEAARLGQLRDAVRSTLHGLQLTPHRTGTDGFYAAILVRNP